MDLVFRAIELAIWIASVGIFLARMDFHISSLVNLIGTAITEAKESNERLERIERTLSSRQR